MNGRFKVEYQFFQSFRAFSRRLVSGWLEVLGLPPAEECEREMFITVSWEDRTLAVPLAQLDALQADKATRQAIEDWHYGVEQGYEFKAPASVPDWISTRIFRLRGETAVNQQRSLQRVQSIQGFAQSLCWTP